MGYSPLLRGRVQGLARGINVPNAAPDASGLASVNPIFTFVRLAQRVPVRIHIDEVPEGVKLVAGLTATVQIEPYKAPPLSGSTPASADVSEAKPRAPAATLAASPQAAAPQALLRKPPAASPPAASRASRQSASVASGSTAGRRTGGRASDAATERLAIAGVSALTELPVIRPALGAGLGRGGCDCRRSQDAPRTDRRQPALREPPPRRLRPIAAAPPALTSCRQANTSGRPSTFSPTRARRPSRRGDLPTSIRRRARSRWRHFGQQ